MKLKNKMIVLLLIIFTILLVVPSMVNAATSTYDDTAQGITWSYELDTGGNIINLKCNTTGVTGTVTIPSTIDGKNVISLAEDKNYGTGAFEECAGITEVIIPNTITKIGYAAFMNCTGLTTITIPDSVTSIGNSVFSGCSGLTAVTLSANLTTIGNGAFRSCTGLTTISIPNKVTMIGNSAFSNCSGLSEVVLSEALTKIPGGCFGECTALKSITLPSSVTTIKNGGIAGGYGAFEGCSALEKILIPDAVATIDNDVFSGCNRLTIYGTEGKRSYTYAQENNINFKLISEWDNVDVGDDITPPTLEKLKIEYGGSFVYDSGTRYYMVAPGTKISIKASFGEMLFGDTAPTLTIKCGKGEGRKLTNGVIIGSYIVYTYEIRTNDVGIISAVEMSGGNVKDEAGNAVTGYSCPTLSTISDILVYANGSGIVTEPDDEENPGETPDDSNDDDKGTSSGTGNNSGTGTGTGTGTGNNSGNGTNTEKDNTTAKGELPKTGKMTLISILIVTIVAGAISFIKTKKYKGI